MWILPSDLGRLKLHSPWTAQLAVFKSSSGVRGKEEPRGSVNVCSLFWITSFAQFFELLESEMARVCQASCSCYCYLSLFFFLINLNSLSFILAFFSVLFLFFPCFFFFFFFFLLLSPESAISVFSVYNTVWRIWVLTRVLSHFLLGNWVSSLAAGTGDLKFCLWTGFTLKLIVLNPIQFPFAGLCCEKSQSWIVIRASWVHPSGWHSF